MGQIHVTLEQASKSLIAFLKAGADYIDGVVTYVHEVVGWLAIHAESAWELFVNDVHAVLLKVMSNAEAWAGQMGTQNKLTKSIKDTGGCAAIFFGRSFNLSVMAQGKPS